MNGIGMPNSFTYERDFCVCHSPSGGIDSFDFIVIVARNRLIVLAWVWRKYNVFSGVRCLSIRVGVITYEYGDECDYSDGVQYRKNHDTREYFGILFENQCFFSIGSGVF